ncbi:hypothetical protein ACKLNR_009816 [Fusarium oxysporum f. sp. zingiberi]
MFLAKGFSSSSLLIIHLLILSSRFPLPITLPSLQNGLPPFTRSRYFLTWEPSSLPAHTKSEFSSPALISDVGTRRRLAKSYKTQDKTTSFPIFSSLGFDLDLINLTLQQEGSDFAVLQFTSELSNGEAPSGDVDADDNDDDGLYDHTLSSSHLSQALPAQSGSPEEPYPKTIFDIQDCENANITSLDNFDLSLKALKGPGSGLDSWSSPIQLVATYDMFIAAVVSYFDKTGVKYVVMDFRKECRRNQEDCRCPILNRTEIEVCGIAMMTEVFIARNIYGVKDKSFEPLLGTLYSTQWHPRAAIDLATEYIPQETAEKSTNIKAFLMAKA